jgi:hypothetical protein
VRVSASEDLIKFNVWYQPGNAKTYYDDNNGELHVFSNEGASHVIQAMPFDSSLQVTATSVRGYVRVRVTDVDFDKVVGMVATVDGWQTVLTFGIGRSDELNKFFWVEDGFGNSETWQINLDLDGVDIQELRYAVFYEHGVVNEARRYTFWDNNFGSDYRVIRGTGSTGGTRG